MQDTLPLLGPETNQRALIYDSKQDMVPILDSMALDCPYLILNPLDKRSHAWDIAADIQTPTEAAQLANVLIPEQGNLSQPFFQNASRDILRAVVVAFQYLAPGKWTFRQVLLTLKNHDRLTKVLSSCPQTVEVVQQYLETANQTLTSLYATMATMMNPFEPVAANWEHARKSNRTFSIQHWLRSSSILVVGNDEKSRSTLDLINQLFLKVASQECLAQGEATGDPLDPSTRRTWFFLDEFREAGNLPGLKDLVLRGRSKGCCVVLGFQDIEGLQDVYGQGVANELVGQCGQKALLRMESPATAEWSSSVVSKAEFLETSYSVSYNNQGGSQSYSEKVELRDVVLPAEFLSLPTPDALNGLQGIYLSRSIGAYRSNYDFKRLLHQINAEQSHDGRKELAPPYLPRETNEHCMEPWNETDEELVVPSASRPPDSNKQHPSTDSSDSQTQTSPENSLSDIERLTN